MCRRWSVLAAAAIVALLAFPAIAGPFVVFPEAGRLPSPDGRYLVRNTDRQAPASEFSGNFHSLWLTELPTNRSYKLCDYVGVAAVAWSGDNYLIITEYVGKKTSRALVFPAAQPENGVMMDAPTLLRLVPVELRPPLRENDHIFVEAARVENQKLDFGVWGYGQHDRNGFRWKCEYGLRDETTSCVPVSASR